MNWYKEHSNEWKEIIEAVLSQDGYCRCRERCYCS